MINVQEIKKIEGLQFYKDCCAVSFLIERGNIIFRIEYPYKLLNVAICAKNAMKNKQKIPSPDYRPCIWIVGAVNQGER